MTPEFTKRGLLTVFFRQWGKFALTFIVVMGLCAAYLYNAKPVYGASGSLLVKFGSDADPNVIHSNNLPQEMPQAERREAIDSDVQLMLSPDLIRKLVEDVGIERIYPDINKNLHPGDVPLEGAVSRILAKDLVVRPSTAGDLMTVTFFSEDPSTCVLVVRRLMDLFLARQTQFYGVPQTQFLNSQVQEAADKLAASQEALRAFKQKQNISSLDDELQQLIKERADSRSVALQAVNDAQATVVDLQMKESNLLNTYRPDSYPVEHLRQSLKLAQAQLHAREQDLKAGSGAGAGEDGKGDIIAAHISAIDSRIAEIEEERTTLNDLLRQVQLDEDNYKNYVTHNEEARVKQLLNAEKITADRDCGRASAAHPPGTPSQIADYLLRPFVAATLGGIGLVLAAEQLDDRFTEPRQLSHNLGVPVMGAFGRVRRRAWR